MNTRVGLILGVALVALMALVAPGRPSSSRVDPVWLLDQAIRANATQLLDPDPSCRSVFRMTVHDRIELLRHNYTPLVEGEDRISGRRAWVMRLKPRLKRRPWRHFWVGKSDFSVLAMREWSHCNTVRRSVIVGTRRAPAHRTISGSGEGSEVDAHCVLRGLKMPGYVPSGFRLADVFLLPVERITQVSYSDGMFSISVFYEPPGSAGRTGFDARASSWKHVRMVSKSAQGTRVRIVGDLPEEELLKMARSL